MEEHELWLQEGTAQAAAPTEMSWLAFALVVAATYRVTRLVIYEDGPANVVWRLRYWLSLRAAWVAKGLACPWCVSFWVAPLLALLALHPVGTVLLAGLAASALASLALQHLEKD